MKPIIPVAMKTFSVDLDALRIPGIDAMQLFTYSFTKTFNFTSLSLREKCPYSEFSGRIRTEYGEMRKISPY